MRLALLLLGLVNLAIAAPAWAGVNYGGVIILHVNENLSYSDGDEYCGMSDITGCGEADVRVDPDGIGPVVVYALAAFAPPSTPRLSGLTFGLSYDEQKIGIERWAACGDFELHTDGGEYPTWPASGSGIAITWNEAQTDHVIECCWFAAYTDDMSPALFSIDEHPVGGTLFADDAVPANLDAVMAFGELGFNVDGANPCDRLTEATLELSPSVLTVYQPCGGSFPIHVDIHDIEDLATFTICTGYDDDFVVFDRVEIDPSFLESTGRNAVLISTNNCNPSCQTEGRSYRVNLQGAGPGPSGSGPLVDVYFTPLNGGAAEDTICEEVSSVGNTSGEQLSCGAGPAIQLTHSPYCFGDFTGDGDVTVFDLSRNIPRWGCCQGDACYDPVYDVNLLMEGNYCASTPDGCIDVIDIQRVAGRWHLGCGGGAPAAEGRTPSDRGSMPSVRISPELQTIVEDIGGHASVTLVVADATDLGAFGAEVSFDPQVLHVTSVEHGEMLSSSGRTRYAFEPRIDNEAGTVRFGACSVGLVPGAEGSGVLAEIVFEIQDCDAMSSLAISAVTLTSTVGAPQELGDVVDGAIEIICAAASVPPGSDLTQTTLFANRPNPVSSVTEITFYLAGSKEATESVELTIFDAAGRLVRTLIDGVLVPGERRVSWDARDDAGNEIASGTYFCRLRAGERFLRQRMVVAR